jgi:hypothetical protein
MSAQHGMTSEQLQMIKEIVMGQLDQINERNTLAKSRIDDHEIRLNTLQRNQTHLQQQTTSMLATAAFNAQAVQATPSRDGTMEVIDANNELRLLRGQMQDERARREQMMNGQQQMFSQL